MTAIITAACLMGCGDEVASSDAAVADSGPSDTGVFDATSSDTGAPDTGAPDTGVSDAGPPDADASARDAASEDAAAADSGTAGPDAGCTAPTLDLVVHYELDETAGAIASDSSGTGNHGTLAGTDGPNWVPGRRGNGLSFDDTDNQVSAAPNASINDLPALTVCAWVYPRSYDDFLGAVVDKSRNGVGGGWIFFLEDNQTFGFETNRGDWASYGPTMLLDWQHLCATWDGSPGTDGLFLYYDGAPVAHGDSGSEHGGTHSDATRNLVVGLVNNGSSALDGVIDDVRLYSRVLTPTEIQSVHDCSR